MDKLTAAEAVAAERVRCAAIVDWAMCCSSTGYEFDMAKKIKEAIESGAAIEARTDAAE